MAGEYAPYERKYYRGVLLDNYTIAWVKEFERKLGAKIDLIQGSYNPGGVGASGGTHDGGGALDFMVYGKSPRRVENVGREVGGDLWHRPAREGVWSEHYHVIIRGNRRLSDAAQWQDGPLEWRANPGGDGLTGGYADPNQYHPKADFNYAKWVEIEKQKKLIARLGDRAAKLRRELAAVRHARKRAIERKNRLLHD